jgi:hypothetical protein
MLDRPVVNGPPHTSGSLRPQGLEMSFPHARTARLAAYLEALAPLHQPVESVRLRSSVVVRSVEPPARLLKSGGPRSLDDWGNRLGHRIE